jgi:hypothetical protein
MYFLISLANTRFERSLSLSLHLSYLLYSQSTVRYNILLVNCLTAINGPNLNIRLTPVTPRCELQVVAIIDPPTSRYDEPKSKTDSYILIAV